jgi:hypothetical protein
MQKLDVTFGYHNWQHAINFVHTHGPFVKSIKFESTWLHTTNRCNSTYAIQNILQHTPNVEKLDFLYCAINITSFVNDDITPIDLKKLKHLSLTCENALIDIVIAILHKCTTLRTLTASFDKKPIRLFQSFMCQQHQLQELELLCSSDAIFDLVWPEDNLDRIYFELKKFTLHAETRYHHNFLKFFKQQSNYIKHLQFIGHNVDFRYYLVLFDKFKNLETLKMPIDNFMSDRRAIEIQKYQNPNLKSIELYGSNKDVSTFKSIINIFPNLKHIIVDNLICFCLHDILSNLIHLEIIQVEIFNPTTMLNAKCPNLKLLEIDFLYPMSSDFIWKNITENCPNIETIIINDVKKFDLAASTDKEIHILLENLTRLKKLLFCSIECEPSIDFDFHRDNFPPYKFILDINSKSMECSHNIIQKFTNELDVLKRVFDIHTISEVLR